MLNINDNIKAMLSAPARHIKGRAELYAGAELLRIFNGTDYLKSVTIERQGTPGKFFGFGVSHKATIKLLDRQRSIVIDKENTFEIELGADADYMYFCPLFYVQEVHRDENTNELTITAVDGLQKAAEYTINDLPTPAEGYSLYSFVVACARLLGLPFNFVNVGADVFKAAYYPGGANFDGTEKLRAALDMVAEATQTIYYIGNNWELTFRRLDKEGEAAFSVDKSKYFALSGKAAQTLSNITHCTELGDNVTASTGEPGTTQYIRDNAFMELRDDVGALVDAAISNMGGITATPFECTWRGNFALEIGDKLSFTTKDGNSLESFFLCDSLTYNGALTQKTNWSAEENKAETAANPSILGEALKQTYAKVDKVNKQIEMVVSEVAENSEEIASLRVNTNRVETSVKTLENKVNATMTAEEVEITIQQSLENDVKKVTTETGFTFDRDGLTVSKSGSEMTTQITEDGMQVFKDNDAVLTADNTGVSAQNLHATTYIIIGNNSRLETYKDSYTACFWIGG